MVVQKAVENLKQKPHEDRQAMAGGIAILVVIVLLFGWGFLFLRKIQKAPPTTLQGSAVPTDQFDYSLLESVESDLSRFYDEAQKSRGTGNMDIQDSRSIEAELGGGQEQNAFGSESNF